ncbi:hypothetical protein EOPP23_19005 [Endozoicomonas sp. OPT23]|nr:hypothetical protein [Endozoicomonas sp. OPT23]
MDKLFQNPEQYFDYENGTESARISSTITMRDGSKKTFRVRSDVYPVVKDHLQHCEYDEEMIKEREVGVLGWSYCSFQDEEINFRAVDFERLPPDELLVPSKKLMAAMHDHSIGDFQSSYAAILKKKYQKEFEKLTEIDRLKAEKILDKILDKRNMIPTLSEIGGKLRASYQEKNDKQIPHSKVRVGNDVPLFKVHNSDRCKRQKFGTSCDNGEFFRGHIGYVNTSFNELLDKELPDISGEIRNILLNKFRSAGINASGLILAGYAPVPIGNAVAENDAYQELPELVYVEHGVFSHMYQLVMLFESGLLNQELLKKIVRAGLWNCIFDLETTIHPNYLDYPFRADSGVEKGVYYHLNSVCSAYPQSLYRMLSSGALSRGIDTILTEGDPERIKKLALVALCESNDAVDKMGLGDLVQKLEVVRDNLRTLEVGDIDGQYKALRRIYPDSDDVHKLCFGGKRRFLIDTCNLSEIRSYQQNGWKIYEIESKNDSHELKILSSEELAVDRNGNFVLLPPEVSELPPYLAEFQSKEGFNTGSELSGKRTLKVGAKCVIKCLFDRLVSKCDRAIAPSVSNKTSFLLPLRYLSRS